MENCIRKIFKRQPLKINKMNLETLKKANEIQEDIKILKYLDVNKTNLSKNTKSIIEKEKQIILTELQRQFNKL